MINPPTQNLLKRKRNKLGVTGLIFSRTGVVLILLVLAALVVFGVIRWFSDYLYQVMGSVALFNFIAVVYLINTDMDSSAKLTWVLVVMATSVFGTLFYIYTRLNFGNRMVRREYERITQLHKDDLPQNTQTLEALQKEAPEAAGLARYLYANDAFPVTRNNEVTFFPLGENKWEALLEELRKAEKFIFMEYFIVEEGTMWGSILSILCEKAKQGVEVRVMYDGTCVLGTLPYNYPQLMQEHGIACRMFSPLLPFTSTHYNNRDHRKIVVIDGKVGFMGGVNLADEYINRKEVYGHWKDTAVCIKGEAVRTLTHMFLNIWSFGEEKPDYARYLEAPVVGYPDARGYVIPYGFNPFEKERVGERVYIDMLYTAKRYVHIMTPYLILDDDLRDALMYAARRGVDVRLIMPGIPDKKAVYDLAWTYFPTLMAAGVKIYLYTPGFVHAKLFVSDDVKAIVGTINLDYRSLYHHFECGTFMYDTECVHDIEADYLRTQEKCMPVTDEALQNRRLFNRLSGRLLRLIAPML